MKTNINVCAQNYSPKSTQHLHIVKRTKSCFVKKLNNNRINILLSDFQIRQNEAWVITNNQRFAPVLKVSQSC